MDIQKCIILCHESQGKRAFQRAFRAFFAGSYHSPGWHTDYPRIQILTIADLFKGAKVQMPMQYGTFKQAKRVREVVGMQAELEMLA